MRHFDRESHDVAELQSATSQYLSRLRYLFVTGGVVRTAGFTELVLQWLRSPHGFMVRGRPKCIGGEHAVDDALIDSCLRPLQVFVRLAAEDCQSGVSELCLAVRLPSLVSREMGPVRLQTRSLA